MGILVGRNLIPRLERETEERLREAQTKEYRRRRRWARLTGKPVPPSYNYILDHVLWAGCAPGLLATSEEFNEYLAQFEPGEAVAYHR